MIPWREHWKRYPDRRLICADRYADVLDAIDDARQRALTCEAGIADEKVVGVYFDKETGEQTPLVVVVSPIVPVRTKDIARLAVGLLQLSAWEAAAQWRDYTPSPGSSVFECQLPSYWRLLQRKFALDEPTAADLARFIVVRHPDNRPEWSEENATLSLGALERNYHGPVRGKLRTALLAAGRRLEAKRRKMQRTRRWNGRKTPTRRIELLIERVAALLARQH